MNASDFSKESISQSAFFTGHRFLKHEDLPAIRMKVDQCVSEAYESGYRRFFCGCALGFDTVAAFRVIFLKKQYPDIRLSLAIPCATQAERWDPEDRKTYDQLLQKADDCTVLSPFYYQGAMLSRNRYMADRSSLCICWLSNMRSGTASAVRYAIIHRQMKVINLALQEDSSNDRLREKTWNYIFISPSADKNAITAPLHLLRDRKLTFKNT